MPALAFGLLGPLAFGLLSRPLAFRLLSRPLALGLLGPLAFGLLSRPLTLGLLSRPLALGLSRLSALRAFLGIALARNPGGASGLSGCARICATPK